MEFHSLKEQREAAAVDSAEARAAAAAAAASTDVQDPMPTSSRTKRSSKKPSTSTPSPDSASEKQSFGKAMTNSDQSLQDDDHNQPLEDGSLPFSGLSSPENVAHVDVASSPPIAAGNPLMRPHNLMTATDIIQNSGEPLSPFTPQPILRLNAIRISGGASKALRPSFLASLCRPYMDPTLSQQNLNPPLLSTLFYGQRTSHPLPGQPTTLPSILGLTSSLAEDLDKLDVFRNIEASLAPSVFPGASDEDVDVILSCGKPKSRVFLKSSTDVGNGEGSASVQGRIRNMFGGAETLQGSATFGTRTKQAFNVEFGAPFAGNPDMEYKLSAFSHDRDYSAFASLSEAIKGVRASINSNSTTELKGVVNPTTPAIGEEKGVVITQHELAYEASVRELNRVTGNASVAVRKMAVHPSVKSALSWTWIREGRDSLVLPSRGWKYKGSLEYAWLGGDANHVKGEFEASTGKHFSPLAWLFSSPSSTYSWNSTSSPSVDEIKDSAQHLSSPRPTVNEKQDALSNLAWTLHPIYTTFTFRSGLIRPLPSSSSLSTSTHFSDRFQLGGPTSIRCFRHSSLGPKSESDSLGGDAFWSVGLSAFTCIPQKPHWPLMLHAFANAGQLCQLDARKNGGEYWKHGATELSQPCSSLGLGLVYMQGQLRVELNAGVPITARNADGMRKGLQLGIGIDFL
ncbi:related to SAM50 - essential component of the SAM or TOB complex of the mitochondrial outer membrane [Melanopsichium pennsylvanicum]|uniref:Related to SAM50 - essential component of the SAM or TOB complex of the mitochondrial outer membrane n=2 Tax=Melanopsichium pennsylvanicum TaxID=63383 RepID=A0AAJ4XK21_9BASI|nr:mitochondrial protein [Melanopsichium pennsylvanicum 4]SNX83794.1 related to SAM50 - essential component of the SAM or TOB complex of the mitochondrial outer membrane [Melanopsichium pennsylvanicum]